MKKMKDHALQNWKELDLDKACGSKWFEQSHFCKNFNYQICLNYLAISEKISW